MLRQALLPQFSIRRIAERWVFKLFGPFALGVAAACLWTKRKGRDFKRPTILVISHVLFDKDIAEVDREGRFNWIYLRRVSKILENLGLPQELRVQRHYFAHLDDPHYRRHVDAARSFGMGLLRTLRLLGPLEGVVSSHLDYWQDIGTRFACARLGVPFLALCHENYNVPKTYAARRDEFLKLGFRFDGTAVATFSEHIRNMFVEAKVCSPAHIVVTGAPRLDGWRRVENKPGRQIVLLSFLNPSKYYASSDFFFSVLDALVDLRDEAGDWELIVKAKGSADLRAINAHIGERANVTVTRDAHLPDLMSRAAIVVGGNSLALVEALLSGATLFVADSSAGSETSIFNFADPAVAAHLRAAMSAADLAREVRQVMREGVSTLDGRARLQLLQRYVDYSPDVSSGKRVAEFLDRYIGRDPGLAPELGVRAPTTETEISTNPALQASRHNSRV